MIIADYVYKLNIRDEPDYLWLLHRCDRLLLLSGTR
jgi:hypothetical protein